MYGSWCFLLALYRRGRGAASFKSFLFMHSTQNRWSTFFTSHIVVLFNQQNAKESICLLPLKHTPVQYILWLNQILWFATDGFLAASWQVRFFPTISGISISSQKHTSNRNSLGPLGFYLLPDKSHSARPRHEPRWRTGSWNQEIFFFGVKQYWKLNVAEPISPEPRVTNRLVCAATEGKFSSISEETWNPSVCYLEMQTKGWTLRSSRLIWTFRLIRGLFWVNRFTFFFFFNNLWSFFLL